MMGGVGVVGWGGGVGVVASERAGGFGVGLVRGVDGGRRAGRRSHVGVGGWRVDGLGGTVPLGLAGVDVDEEPVLNACQLMRCCVGNEVGLYNGRRMGADGNGQTVKSPRSKRRAETNHS